MAVVSNPHDALFREILAHPENAASELAAVLPSWVSQRVDWSSLALVPGSFVTGQLRSRYSDLLFRASVQGRAGFVYVLIEHQTSNHRFMALRMLEYTVQIWVRYLEDHPHARLLPVVIPLVVHNSHSGGRWTAPTSLGDLIDIDIDVGGEASRGEDWETFLPRYSFLLDDLTGVDLAALRGRRLTPATVLLLVLQQIAPANRLREDDLLPLLDELRLLVASPGGIEVLQVIIHYILVVSDTTADDDLAPIIEQLGQPAKEALMTTADRLRAEGEARGETRGIALGETLGRAAILLEQLTVKFGHLPVDVTDRVRAAGTGELETWAVRVLTASSLNEVFEHRVNGH